MSHSRDITRALRAALAIVVACALMFSVSAAGAAVASETDFTIKNNGSASVGLFACFKRHMTQRADAASADKAQDGQKNAGRHCPCCLAAHHSAAVLPDRAAPPAVLRAAPSPLYQRAFMARAPEGVRSRAAHGARAPPFSI